MWDTETFTDKLYVDDEILEIKSLIQTSLNAIYLPNDDAISTASEGASIMLLGGTIGTRNFGQHTLYLEAPLGGIYRIGLNYKNETTYVDIPSGGISYYNSLEVGVLDTPSNKGYILIYALNDTKTYLENKGII